MPLLEEAANAFARALVSLDAHRSRPWALIVQDANHDELRHVRGRMVNVQSREDAEALLACSSAGDRWGELQSDGMCAPLGALRHWIDQFIPLCAADRRRAIDDFTRVVHSTVEKK